MANQFLSATWGSKKQPTIVFKTQPVASPSATSNPRGIRAAVGKRAPITTRTIGMTAATREDRFKQTPTVSITPAIAAPTEKALGISTREQALRLDRKLQSQVPLPTNLLNRKRPLVTYKELTNADQDLIDAEVKPAKPYKSGLESITSAMIGDLTTDDRRIARQIRAFEVISRTRPLSIAEQEDLNRLKSEYIGNVAAVPAELVDRRAAMASVAQRMSAEQKAIEDNLLAEANSYLQEKLGREAEVTSAAQREAARIQERAADAADALAELEADAQASSTTIRDLTYKIANTEEALDSINQTLRDEDVPDEERADLEAEYRNLEAARERMLLDRGLLTEKIDQIEDRIQGQRELLNRTPAAKKRLEIEYKKRLVDARKSRIGESFGQATQAYLKQPKKQSAPGQAAGEVEILLRKIVGPTAAYKLSRQLLTGDVDEEKEEEVGEYEPAFEEEAEGAWPIEFEPSPPRSRRPSVEAKAPSRKPSGEAEVVQDVRLNPAMVTEEFIADHDPDEAQSVLKTLAAKKREIEDPPPGYPQLTEQQERKQLSAIAAGTQVATKQLEKLNAARGMNTELAEALSDDEFREKWIKIQLKTGNMSEEDKRARLSVEDLKRMFLVLRSDHGYLVNRNDPPGFDVHRNEGKKIKGGLPNAKKETLAKYLAKTIPKYYS